MVLGRTFKRGFHIPSRKELSRGRKYIEIPAPDIMKYPMLQHIGTPAKPIVEVGDYIKVGQKIGEKVGAISANVHSSVSGKVTKIEHGAATRGDKVLCIYIENDHKYELAYEEMNRDYTKLSSKELVSIIDEAGITGLGGASFPTSVKLTPPEPVSDVIINAAECEPYLTSDDTMMRNFADDIVTGLKIEMQVLNAKNGHILIEDDKPEAIKSMQEAVKNEPNIEVVVAKAKYPQGDEKRVIDVVLGKEVPFGKQTYSIGAVVSNATTAYSITQAVVHNKPLIERIVTFTGDAMKQKLNALVKFGTPVSDAIKYIGGIDESVERLIFGGPMMGYAFEDLQIPFEKPTNGLLALTREETNKPDRDPCIKCMACVEMCPVGLQPFNLEILVSNGDIQEAKSNDLMACIECGLCSYICPSHIPLVETFKQGKAAVRKMEQEMRG